MSAFEHISEPVTRVIYSCEQEIISQLEKAEALKRAKSMTRKAINHEWQMKERAQALRKLAIKGSLRAIVVFAMLAEQYDDAVLARRACERIERNYQ